MLIRAAECMIIIDMAVQDFITKKLWLRMPVRLAACALILLAVSYAAYTSPYNPHPASAEDIQRWVAGFGTLAPLIYIGVYTVRPVLLLPALLLNLSAGLLFGPWKGMFFLVLGGMGCACFCYLAGRFGGGSWLLESFGGSWGRRLSNYLTRENSFVKMLWLRTVPIFPYDPVSILAGSAGVPLKTYIGATALGMLPGAVAYNFLAASFGSGELRAGIILTLLAFGVPLICWLRFGDAGINERREHWWQRIWKRN